MFVKTKENMLADLFGNMHNNNNKLTKSDRTLVMVALLGILSIAYNIFGDSIAGMIRELIKHILIF